MDNHLIIFYIFAILFGIVRGANKQMCSDLDHCKHFSNLDCYMKSIKHECCAMCQKVASKFPPNCPYGEIGWCRDQASQCHLEDIKIECCLTCSGFHANEEINHVDDYELDEDE